MPTATAAPAGGRHAAGAGSRKWCPTCTNAGTHTIGGANRPCFLDPREQVNVPASVWADKARVAAITKGRDANARDLGITAGKLVPPSADAIKRYEDYAKDGKGGGKGGGRRGGGRGGGCRGGGAHAGAHVDESTREWLDSLADLTMVTVDDMLHMNIANKRAGVDNAAALEAVADPANTNEDETAVDDEAWLSGTREIDWNGSLIDDDTLDPPKVATGRWPHVLDDIDCPEWLKEAAKHFNLEACAVSSSGDGAPIAEKANIFFKEGAAPGRAWRSAEHGLPAASTTPQAPQAELATTSPVLPPTTPGAPGYLGSSVSAEFPSLGSAFFVGGTGPGGEGLRAGSGHVLLAYYCIGRGRRWNRRQRIPWRRSGGADAASKIRVRASDGAGLEEWSTQLPSTPALASGLDTTVKFTPAPATRSLVPCGATTCRA